MTVILIITALGWIFALIGWWYESRYRKKTVKAIRQELKAEIRWIEINNYQDIKKKETGSNNTTNSIYNNNGRFTSKRLPKTKKRTRPGNTRSNRDTRETREKNNGTYTSDR